MTSISQNDEAKNQSEKTYHNVVFQSLNILIDFRKDFLYEEAEPENTTNLTKSLKSILYGSFNTQNDIFLQDILKYYNEKSQNNNEALIHDPYHFLKYLLIYLNEENFKLKTEINKNLETEFMEDPLQAAKLFEIIYSNSKNSIILRNFYYSEITYISCNFCNQNKIKFSLNPILDIDLKQSIEMRNIKKPECINDKISLRDCLKFYFHHNPEIKCPNPNCGVNANIFKLVKYSPKVLIIHINRNEHTGLNDIDISIDLDIHKHFLNKTDNTIIKYFTLKACICYKGNKDEGYYVDYCIKRGEKDANWYRYDGQYKKIEVSNLFEKEPILLIYEAKENNPNIMGDSNINNVNNNNNFNSNIIQHNNMNNNMSRSSINSINMMNQNMMNTMNSSQNFNHNMNFNQPFTQTNQMNNKGDMGYMDTMNNNFSQINNQMYNMGQTNNNFYMGNVGNQVNTQYENMNFYSNVNPMNQNANLYQNNALNNQESNNNFGNSINNISNNSGNENDNDPNNIEIEFIIVSEDNQQNEKYKIKMQVKTQNKFNEIVKSFLFKAQKDKNYIKKYIFNNNEISQDSTQTANEINLTNGSIIKAIENPSNLNNVNSNINNNGNYNNNIVNNNDSNNVTNNN